MESSKEYRIKIIILICTLLWHGFIVFSLFVLTRTDLNEPLRITINPRPIQYSLYSNPKPPLQRHSQSTQLPHVLPAVTKPVAQASLQAPPPDDNQAEPYMLKNAVSGGTLAQGSIVPASGNGSTSQQIQKQEIQEHAANQPAQQSQNSSDQNSPSKVKESDEDLDQSLPSTNKKIESDSEETPQAALAEKSPITPVQQRLNEFNEPIIQLPSDATTTFYNQTMPKQAPHKVTSAPSQPPQKPRTSLPLRSANPATRAPASAQKQLSLADLARSYARQLKDEQHATSRYTYGQTGSSNGFTGPMGPNGVYAPQMPGTELAEQIYASKLYALLEQSAQAYSRQIFSVHDVAMQTMIEITIDKSGKILDVSLNPTLPEKDMEQALCIIVKRVGMFPPIPKQFKKTRIILTIPIHIQSQKGFASYHLLYGRRA